jgi:hypothetical protein
MSRELVSGNAKSALIRANEREIVSMIKLDEARLMFGKWLDEKAWVLCVFKLLACGLSVIGRVTELSDTSILFVSRRGDTKFLLRLDLTDTTFWYATRRELSEGDFETRDEERDLGGIGVAFPLRVTLEQVTGPLRVPERDQVLFLEIPEGDVDMDIPPR